MKRLNWHSQENNEFRQKTWNKVFGPNIPLPLLISDAARNLLYWAYIIVDLRLLVGTLGIQLHTHTHTLTILAKIKCSFRLGRTNVTLKKVIQKQTKEKTVICESCINQY